MCACKKKEGSGEMGHNDNSRQIDNSRCYCIAEIFQKVKFLERSVQMYWVKIFGGFIFGKLGCSELS